MKKNTLDLTVSGQRVGFVKGEFSCQLQPILVDAFTNGWGHAAEKIPSSDATNVYFIAAPINGFYKEFLARDKWEGVKSIFLTSRCQKYIVQSEQLIRHGIATPKILASGKLAGNEFVVTDAVPGVSFGELFSALFRQCNSKPALQLKRRLLVSLGEYIGRLHGEGIVHGDLRPNNILLAMQGQQPQWFLIDNERNTITAKPTRKQIIKNLVQINMFHSVDMTMSDRRRFFSSYFRVNSSLQNVRSLEREVILTVKKRLQNKPVFQPDKTKVMKKISALSGFNDFVETLS